MGGTRRGRVVTVILCLTLVTALVPTVAADPNVDVRIGGTGVQGGETITVTDDPRVEIDASADAAIESVAIEVDGETRRSYEPGSETFDEWATLDLDDGEYEVSVVVEASDTRRVTATVRKDSTAPRVTYTSPFESDGYPSGGAVTIGNADTTLAADLADRSEISDVRIERNYEWTFAQGSNRDRTVYRIDDPGENVSKPLLFGLGENDLRVEVIDEHGNRRTHDVTVTVEDFQRPSIDVDRFERTASDRLEVAGTVSDNVKLNSLEYRIESSGDRQFVVNPTSKEPTQERIETDFEFTASITEDTESVTLVATDVAGNVRSREVPIDYRGHLVPTITIDREATSVQGDRIAFAGEVSDSRISEVVVDSVAPDGETIDTLTVHDGAETDSVPLRGRIGGASGSTTLIVRVTDIRGGTHREAFEIDTSALQAAAPTAAAATPTATPTPVATATSAITATPTSSPTFAGGDDGGNGGSFVPLASPQLLDGGAVFLGIAGIGFAILVVVGLTMHRNRESVVENLGEVVNRLAAGGRSVAALGLAGAERTRTALGGVLATLRSELDDATDDDTWTDSSGSTGVGGSSGGGGSSGVGGSSTDDATTKQLRTADRVADLAEKDPENFNSGDVSALVSGLDTDDPETMATAAELLGEVAASQPDLVAGTGATPRLRDLRMADDEEVRTATTQAVGKFRQAGLL